MVLKQLDGPDLAAREQAVLTLAATLRDDWRSPGGATELLGAETSLNLLAAALIP